MQSSLKETKKRRQAETIHVVDLAQVTDDKEQLAALLSKWQVSVSFLHISPFHALSVSPQLYLSLLNTYYQLYALILHLSTNKNNYYIAINTEFSSCVIYR